MKELSLMDLPTIQAIGLSADDLTFDPRAQHHKGAGLHIRQMHLPAGKTSISHSHAEDHLSILASGSCRMISVEGVSSHTGPTCILIKTGIQYAITAASDVVWFCISDLAGDDDKLNSLGD